MKEKAQEFVDRRRRDLSERTKRLRQDYRIYKTAETAKLALVSPFDQATREFDDYSTSLPNPNLVHFVNPVRSVPFSYGGCEWKLMISLTRLLDFAYKPKTSLTKSSR